MGRKFFTEATMDIPNTSRQSENVKFEPVREDVQEKNRKANQIIDMYQTSRQEQMQIIEEVLGDEIESGEINSADIDYETRKQIEDYYKRSDEEQEGKEYLVRGALLRCSCGTNSRQMNLSPCHGVYFKAHPLVHKMDCKQGAEPEDNITWFGVCEKHDLETEEIVLVDDNGNNQTGKKCCPEIIGSWRNTYSKAQIADNHAPSEQYELYDALTIDSYLICRHGGIITPVNSGQEREVQQEEFKYGKEAYDRVMNYEQEDSLKEEQESEDDFVAVDDNAVESFDNNVDEDNDIMIVPEPGDEITISRGIELEDETATVSSWHAWSIEYSVESCNSDHEGDLCCRRLNYAVENYECNSSADDLLMFRFEGYDEPVFAGAMVEGYANIGDIVQVTLDDDRNFNFLILDVKSTKHSSEELAKDKQCQCEWGHGYMLDADTVQLQVCEFITAGNCSVQSAIHTESGAFLTKKRVVKAQIIDSVYVGD